jgi:hypothetical protein
MMVARSAVAGLASLAHLVVTDLGPGRGQRGQWLDRHRMARHGQAGAVCAFAGRARRALDLPHPCHVRCRGQRLGGGLQVGRRFHDQRPGAGVGQDPFHLLGR